MLRFLDEEYLNIDERGLHLLTFAVTISESPSYYPPSVPVSDIFTILLD